MSDFDRSAEAILQRHVNWLQECIDSETNSLVLLMEKHPERLTGRSGFKYGMSLKAHKMSLEVLQDELQKAGIGMGA